MKRKAIRNKKLDARVFRNTANKTKKINVVPTSARGGIRL